jgi:adenylate kinase
VLPPNTVVIFLGPPGAGKGSQARLLSRACSCPLLLIGDTLREISTQNTFIGQRVHRNLASGELMDNEIIAEVVRTRTQNPDCIPGYFIDGYPRNLAQAEWLDEWAAHQENNIVAIYLSIPKELVFRRALGRGNCVVCGEAFNTYTRPSRVISLCDSCGNQLGQRKDDVREILELRYQTFESETLPLLDYYERGRRLISLDGRKPVESVFRDLQIALRQRT